MSSAPRICLMSCCAPCSAGAIVELKEQGADFCVLFYNPNIFPESEYQKRLDQQIRLCEELGVKYAVCGADVPASAGMTETLQIALKSRLHIKINIKALSSGPVNSGGFLRCAALLVRK